MDLLSPQGLLSLAAFSAGISCFPNEKIIQVNEYFCNLVDYGVRLP